MKLNWSIFIFILLTVSLNSNPISLFPFLRLLYLYFLFSFSFSITFLAFSLSPYLVHRSKFNFSSLFFPKFLNQSLIISFSYKVTHIIPCSQKTYSILFLQQKKYLFFFFHIIISHYHISILLNNFTYSNSHLIPYFYYSLFLLSTYTLLLPYIFISLYFLLYFAFLLPLYISFLFYQSFF